MSDQDIFGKDTSSASDQDGEQTNTNPETDNGTSEVDLLQEIRNPDTGEPKYKTVEEALKALKNAQEFIPKLQQENATYKSDIESAREELVKATEAFKSLDRLAKPPAIEESPPAPQAPKEEVNIEDLVEEALTRRETTKQKMQNTQKVTTALKEKFGEKAGELFYGKAQELGLDRATMNELAAKSPEAVLAYFKDSPASSNNNAPTSTVKTEGLKEEKKRFGPLAPPTKSVLAGASNADLVAEMRRHRQAVYEKYGIEQ